MNLAYCCRACKIAELKKQKTQTDNSLVLHGLDKQVEMTENAFLLCPNCSNPDCPRANDHRNACVRPL